MPQTRAPTNAEYAPRRAMPHICGPESERGGAVGVEMALLWIVLILMILAVIQAALVFYAGQLALTAAEDGVRSGRYYTETQNADTARRDTQAFLDKAAGTSLTGVAVTADVDAATGAVRVEVTGEALSLVPGVRIRLSREAVGGLERVTP